MVSDGCKARFIPYAISCEERSIRRSISREVTIISGKFSGSLPVAFLIIVWVSITVGTPMAITGTPILFSESSLRAFATPLPGDIPESEICIVVPRRLTSAQARASTAIIPAGFI